jgi:hypothetical protein
LLVLGLELGSKNQTQFLIQFLRNLIRTPEPTVLTPRPPQTEYPPNTRLIPAQHWLVANSMLCWWVLQVHWGANPRFTLLAFELWPQFSLWNPTPRLFCCSQVGLHNRAHENHHCNYLTFVVYLFGSWGSRLLLLLPGKGEET